MISYKPLLKLMIDRDIKKQDLQKQLNASWSTIAKFNTNEKVSLDIIDKLCSILDCQPGDLIEHIPDPPQEDDQEKEKREQAATAPYVKYEGFFFLEDGDKI